MLEGSYRTIDGLLGKYMEFAGDDTLLIVLSDHGMKGMEYEGKPAPSGEHRGEGLLLIKGPGVRKGTSIEAGVLDITPTLLYCLGLPVAEDMDGRILKNAFDEEFLSARRETFVSTYEEKGSLSGEGEALKSPADRQIEEHLRSLGYIR